MQGPIAARMRERSAPNASMALTRRLDDSAERALPSRMRRADHACRRIGEQHRRAVGGEHAERDLPCPSSPSHRLWARRRATKAPRPSPHPHCEFDRR